MMEAKREPLVSIILPVYNGEKYLSLSIESCINQTYTNWELLIIDDGSSDGSASISRNYAERDKRIFYYKNSHNMKLPKSLNRGFELAKGEYLTWTSDDNYYRPYAIEKMVTALQKNDAQFIFAAYSTINNEGKRISVNKAPEDYLHAIWAYDLVGACFLYTKKVYETIGEYNPALFLCEDYDYWLRIFGKFDVKYLDEELYVYRAHSTALSQTHKYEQYEMVEKVLLKNFAEKTNPLTIDKFYLLRGLNRSRSLQKSIFKRYRYLPKLLCYKIWHKLFC